MTTKQFLKFHVNSLDSQIVLVEVQLETYIRTKNKAMMESKKQYLNELKVEREVALERLKEL
jgi:hypothetical protein